jgi:hypothetical protein
MHNILITGMSRWIRNDMSLFFSDKKSSQLNKRVHITDNIYKTATRQRWSMVAKQLFINSECYTKINIILVK